MDVFVYISVAQDNSWSRDSFHTCHWLIINSQGKRSTKVWPKTVFFRPFESRFLHLRST